MEGGSRPSGGWLDATLGDYRSTVQGGVSQCSAAAIGNSSTNGILRDELTYHLTYTAWGVAAIAMTSLAFLVTLSGAGVVFRFRDRPIMRMSQRTFLGAITAGSCGVTLGIFVYVVFQEPTRLSCSVFNAVSSLSITLLLTALLLKEYRAFVLHKRTRRLRRTTHLSTERLSRILGCNIALVAVLDALWFTLGPAPSPSTCSLTLCAIGPWGKAVWAYITFLAVLCVILSGFAFRVSTVASESHGILACGVALAVGILIDCIVFFFTNTTAQQIKLTVATTWFVVSLVAMWFFVFRKLQWRDLSSAEVRDRFLRKASPPTCASSPLRLKLARQTSRNNSSRPEESSESGPTGPSIEVAVS